MDWTYFETTLIPLVVATILGGSLGLEREFAGRWAGLRTHMLVALSSATFVVVGVTATQNAPAELSRVIQGVAAGVGFIGAGTILKLSSVRRVRGLTTAASIWTASALGVAAGLRLYPLSVTATIITLFILKVLDRWDQKIDEITDEPTDLKEDD